MTKKPEIWTNSKPKAVILNRGYRNPAAATSKPARNSCVRQPPIDRRPRDPRIRGCKGGERPEKARSEGRERREAALCRVLGAEKGSG
ncbi:hypothetical protein L596_018691 [Steinernema carpocapsae]|uniref:Uncharacterized protein n=1 Tax=Steinernema carpocapsae TaxID=34508 RepID=A0A4U5N5F8_STECR|nr:hypothetical protein L596_018691 [Steinernema carpocapsae]